MRPDDQSPEQLPDAKAIGETITKLLTDLGAESERAAVILGVAYLDQKLEELLASMMRPSADRSDELFGAERPLGTLSAKIKLCARLGLIEDPVVRALDALRKIRNKFAHSVERASLEDDQYRDLLATASQEALASPVWRMLELADELVQSVRGDKSELSIFQKTLACILVAIETAVAYASPLECGKPATFEIKGA